ncbi:MAG: hypothetical protein JGK17_26605 [Microcoleus sp. PH2017_10_PVI_O_A]|uniref:hypothetical protein n=1 Tax=unclassified Microcoleus TaxID=2642155 RepID=UPI001DCE06DF|nr:MULTISPECIES: hypothetical protein [unclassified Microcoleus]TAE83896.1 MAG: hypothetical protein EAZ83_08230 [Oscillatoriales cyanobacterium]MCC3409080.1 hypothetical protein [Microcoleus sp. PH2017_10_PVI_O_A]MCC3463196.1 hypothetical protein [Microcoleus sp. PH2017_11_PCY_U_A]MCC3477779.1 hypothetical protein [Microcoleus sp. PH2017_12_PCY_D_A]MCC3529830.1 hypothetical protein [Microcoleus sp. PH2017_21_RUC_O_A]
MVELNWHDYLVMVSFVASIAGLVLLGDKCNYYGADDRTLSEEIPIKMSFTYWIVYCISVFGLKLHLPDDSWLLLSLKLTTVLSYLLTASSILSLPLQRMAVRRVEE